MKTLEQTLKSVLNYALIFELRTENQPQWHVVMCKQYGLVYFLLDHNVIVITDRIPEQMCAFIELHKQKRQRKSAFFLPTWTENLSSILGSGNFCYLNALDLTF